MPAHAVHHIGVAVPDLDAAAGLFARLTGATPTEPEALPAQGVRVCFVGAIELLEPLGPDTTVGRFLERRGPALHHVAYRVPDVAAELARLADDGFALIDQAPRPGAAGHLVAFLHPKSTGGVLVELVQEAGHAGA